MLEPTNLLLIAIVFMLAGMVKGVIGLGLPTISLALLTVAIDLPSAMALLILPSFITNVWQTVGGGNTAAVIKRIWPFLTAAGGTVWVGAIALSRIDSASLSALLGVLLITYAVLGLTGLKMTLTKKAELMAGPALGIANGLLTGMTGSFVVPGVMYLQSLDLPRNELIQAMGMLFTVSTLALAIALSSHGLLDMELGLISTLAIVPAIVGMYFGRSLGQRLSEKRFKQVFYCALLCLGIYIMVAALYR